MDCIRGQRRKRATSAERGVLYLEAGGERVNIKIEDCAWRLNRLN